MKKFIAILSACLIALGVCAACGNTADTETTAETAATEIVSETEATEDTEIESDTEATDSASSEFPYMTINSEAFSVTVEDGFDNAGVTTYICDTTAEYSFTCNNDEVSWDVYVLDAPFEDAVRFISQAEEAVLSGNGNVEIKEGQYIYLVCSCSAFTAEEVADAILSINYADAA